MIHYPKRVFLVEKMALYWAIMACFKKHVKDSVEPLQCEYALILRDISKQEELTDSQFNYTIKVLKFEWWNEYCAPVLAVEKNLLHECKWKSLQANKVHYFLSNYGFPDMFMSIDPQWMETATITQKVDLARDLFLCLKAAREAEGYISARSIFRLEEENQRMLQYGQWIDVERMKALDYLSKTLKEQLEKKAMEQNTKEKEEAGTNFAGLFESLFEQVHEMTPTSLGELYLNVLGVKTQSDSSEDDNMGPIESLDDKLKYVCFGLHALQLSKNELWPGVSTIDGELDEPLVQFLLELSDVVVSNDSIGPDSVMEMMAAIQALFIEYIYPNYTRIVDGEVVITSEIQELFSEIQYKEYDMSNVATFAKNLCQHYTLTLDSMYDAINNTRIHILAAAEAKTPTVVKDPIQSGLASLANQ